MEMAGEQNVPLSREKVWEALNDPEVLGACIPGCESMEQVGDNEFKSKVRAAVGPVNAQFKGKVTLSDINKPESYTMSFKGDGNAGFAQGSAKVRLSESGDGTTINYNADAKVGGKLAQIGSRLVDGAAQKMADDFFANMTVHMGGTPAEPAGEPSHERGLIARIVAAIARLFGRG